RWLSTRTRYALARDLSVPVRSRDRPRAIPGPLGRRHAGWDGTAALQLLPGRLLLPRRAHSPARPRPPAVDEAGGGGRLAVWRRIHVPPLRSPRPLSRRPGGVGVRLVAISRPGWLRAGSLSGADGDRIRTRRPLVDRRVVSNRTACVPL